MRKIATRKRIVTPIVGPRVKPGMEEPVKQIVKKEDEDILKYQRSWLNDSKGPVIKAWEEHMKTGARAYMFIPPALNTIYDVEDLIAIGGSLTQKINFGPLFNDLVPPGLIPESVTELAFGDSFNQEILPGVIPESVEYLRFGNSFDKPLNKDILPRGLKALMLSPSYPHKLDL